MTEMKWRYELLGGRYHVAVFTRTLPTETWAKNGDLVFDDLEWSNLRPQMEQAGVVFEKAPR